MNSRLSEPKMLPFELVLNLGRLANVMFLCVYYQGSLKKVRIKIKTKTKNNKTKTNTEGATGTRP